MTTPRSDRSGFTLLEVVIAVAVLTIVVGLALGAMGETSQAVVEGSMRSYMVQQGNGAVTQVERDVSSAGFTAPDQITGTWDGTTFTPATATGTGNALRFLPVKGWDTTSQTMTTDPPVVYAFMADEAVDNADNDGDGLVDELKLVREIVGSGFPVELVKDIGRSSVTNEQAAFTQVGFTSTNQRAELEIRFTMARRQDRTTFVKLTFAKRVTLRNAMN